MKQNNTASLPSGTEPGLSEKKPQQKRSRKWFRIVLIACVLLLLKLACVLAWLAATESGLRFGIYQIPSWFGVKISSKTLDGTLLKGFRGEQWRIETEGADVDVSGFVFDWQPKALWEEKLHIRRIAAGDIHIQTKPVGPDPKTDSKMPESVKLPVAAAVDSLEVGRITSGKEKTVLIRQARLSYRYDHRNHTLKVLTLKSPWSDAAGSVTLNTVAPFALNGNIHSDGILDEVQITNDIKLGGNLKTINFNTDMKTVVGKPDAAAVPEGGGNDIKFFVDAVISPFGKGLHEIIGNVQIKGHNINPRAFLASAPQAHFDFDATVVPSDLAGIALEGSLDLENLSAAEADAGGIPVRSVVADFKVDKAGVLSLSDAGAALLKEGRIDFGGSTDTGKGTLNIDTDIRNVVLADMVKQSFADPINGRLQLRGTYANPQAVLNMTVGKTAASGEVALVPEAGNQSSVSLKNFSIKPENGGELAGSGSMALYDKQNLAFALTGKNFNPNRLYPELPSGSVNGDFKVDGRLADNYIAAMLNFGRSTLSDVVLSGKADLIYDKDHLSRIASNIQLGANRLFANGSFGRQGDRLSLDVNAPDMSRFGFGMGGLLVAKGVLAGHPKKLEADIAGRAENLRIRKTMQINRLDFQLKGSPDISRPFNIKADGRQIVIPGESDPTRIDSIALTVNGTGRNHSIRGNGSMQLSGKPYRLNLAANGGLNERNQWKGVVDALDISGAFNLKLQNRLNFEAGAERVSMSAARWSAMGGSLNLQNFVWDSKQGITTKGSADNLHMAQLHNFYTPSVEHNLVLNGDWDVVYARNMHGYINIRRQSGDIVIPYRKQALGLGALALQTRFQNGRIDNTVSGTTRYGNVNGNLVISQNFGNDITQAPINGKINLTAPDLEAFRHLMPVGQGLKGRLAGEALISGRLGQPQFNGTLNGDNLYYRNQAQGVILDNGTLRSRLSGQRWHIDSLTFRRRGTATLSGSISLAANNAPDVDVSAVFNQYHILDKPNRRLTISGNTKLLYSETAGVTLTGLLKADRGHFGFQDSSMPVLDDDVVVIGETKSQTAATPITMNLTLDLNNNFNFSGEGLDVTLGGQLALTAHPGENVKGIGTVNVVKGKYKAYGQDLNIEKGKISFVGPLDDPNLNIRATRNLSPVGAGVEVLGSLSKPRVTLVANEAMSEKDKLSWLILNRASSGNDSDEAALATAAGAFLAGRVNDRIGLVDNFGLTSQRTRNAQTGELNPAEQILTFGKQLTGELYFGYEYGISSASQSVKLIYQLTRSLQAIGRVGTQSSGGELKYIIRFD